MKAPMRGAPNAHWIVSSLALGTLATAGLAHAGCTGSVTRPAWDVAGPLASARYVPGPEAGRLMQIADWYEHEQPTIVGLWKFEMISKSTSTNHNPMPDGTLIDFGTTAWHSDGTELMNSGSRNPADNDICQGTWAQVAEGTFRLHHVALAWTGGTYTGPTIIEELVTVDRSRQHFNGVFTINAYLATETPGHEFDETTPLATITGTLTATRVSP
jgi:hypothetical protein